MIEMIVTSSTLILATFLLRRLTNGKISMRLRYALWLAAALRLMLPVSVGESAVSVMNLLPQSLWQEERVWEASGGWALPGIQRAADVEERAGTESDTVPMEEKQALAEVSAVPKIGEKADEAGKAGGDFGKEAKAGQAGVAAELSAGRAPEEVRRTDEASESGTLRILRMVWAVGTLSVGACMLIIQIRFRRILYRNRHRVGGEKIPEEMADRLAGYGMKVYQVNGLASPCLVGRNIYVDTKLVREPQKFVHVLAHEYCHALQFDRVWAFLRSALAAVYWFHPLVWAAAFAARQDSELSCDEAVIRLLGEQERFDYGRTLLYLLAAGQGRIACAGTALTMEGQKKGVKERVRRIAGRTDRKGWTAAVVLVTMLLVCGCAFTGSGQKEDGARDERKQAGRKEQAAEQAQKDAKQAAGNASDQEAAGISSEYEDVMGAIEAQEQAIEQAQQDAAFLSVLHYQGVMAGRDDSELALDRKIDYQAYYTYLYGQQEGQDSEPENPLENGWYLLSRNEEAQISLYGLYTQDFGPRGIKTLIGEDVNTYDIAWCPSGMNEDSANIRTLEETDDGLPRRFVFKILAENTSEREIWKLYSGFRYDTGTVEMKELTPEMYRDWVDKNLSFTMSESGDEILLTYDGDMVLAPLSISDYQDYKVEEAVISPDVAGFALNSSDDAAGIYEGYEGVLLQLAVGLKLEGVEGIWCDGLHPLTIQVLCHPEKEPAFELQQPRVDEQNVCRSLVQERRLEVIRSEKEAGIQSSKTEGRLDSPLVNREAAHHDLEIDFINPCPDYDRISDQYGERIHPITGESIKHNGVDMAAKEGADILAAADGTVFETGFDTEDGNYVVLWHGQSGQMTYYTHCKEVLVSEKEQVLAGDKIATVGTTGKSTGYHLHFAVSYEGVWQEPFWGEGQIRAE